MSHKVDLNGWKRKADYWITPIEKVKNAFKTSLQKLDQDYPDWKSKYDSAPAEYLKHDARREFFTTIRIVLQNNQLGYIFIRDQLSNQNWWIHQVGQVKPMAITQAIREQALMLKFFNVHAIAMATESTFRAIVRAEPNIFGVTPMTGIEKLTNDLLTATSLEKYKNFFNILRLVKNTIHNNGVFYIYGGKNVHLSYNGRSFDFEIGKELSWLTEDFLVWMPAQLNDAMFELVTSSKIASIPYCPRAL